MRPVNVIETEADYSDYHRHAQTLDMTPLADAAISGAKQALRDLTGLGQYDRVCYEAQCLSYTRKGIVQCVRLATSSKSSRVLYMKLVVNGLLRNYKLTFPHDVTYMNTYEYVGPDTDEEGHIDDEELLDTWGNKHDGC